MKSLKIFFLILMISMLVKPVIANTVILGGVTMEWPLLNQMEREKIVTELKNTLFNDNVVYKIEKKEFKNKYEKNWKDKNLKENKTALKYKLKKLTDKKLAGFYFLDKVLIAYGVEYDNDLYHVYYYDALGNLRYVDILDKPYNDYPNISYQYDINGTLKGLVYNISEYDQYVFKPDGKFYGRWYNEKLYDKKAKIIMTRKIYD